MHARQKICSCLIVYSFYRNVNGLICESSMEVSCLSFGTNKKEKYKICSSFVNHEGWPTTGYKGSFIQIHFWKAHYDVQKRKTNKKILDRVLKALPLPREKKNMHSSTPRKQNSSRVWEMEPLLQRKRWDVSVNYITSLIAFWVHNCAPFFIFSFFFHGLGSQRIHLTTFIMTSSPSTIRPAVLPFYSHTAM